MSRNYCISPLDVNGKAMSELDLYAIGRCQEQVTRENLESNAISLHSTKQYRRIYMHTMVIVILLILMNELQRLNGGGSSHSADGTNCTYNNQTEIDHEHRNDVRKKEFKHNRMACMLTSRWAYQLCIRIEGKKHKKKCKWYLKQWIQCKFSKYFHFLHVGRDNARPFEMSASNWFLYTKWHSTNDSDVSFFTN